MTTSSIDRLAKTVQEAAEELKKLRRENDRLKEKAAKLEQRLEATPEVDPAESAWVDEREQIRGRIERLAEHLEEVLGSES